MTLKKLTTNNIIILILATILFKIPVYNEPIFLFCLYIIFFNKRYYIFAYSSLLYLFFDINLLLKNIILFLLYEIHIVIKLKKKNSKYQLFLLTFFGYLVLINIFEPMIYNFTRIFNSIINYFIVILIIKLDNLIKRGVL